MTTTAMMNTTARIVVIIFSRFEGPLGCGLDACPVVFFSSKTSSKICLKRPDSADLARVYLGEPIGSAENCDVPVSENNSR